MPGMPPYLSDDNGTDPMIEVMFMYQLARRPIQAIARKWVCRGLHRVTKGEYRCPECDQSQP